jgi:DNA-binding NarL/FixJ family response regulator
MKAEMNKTRIVIADAQYLTGIALNSILQETYEVAAACSNHQDLLKWLEEDKAELLILDPILLDVDMSPGIESLREKVPMIMIITHEISQADFTQLNAAGIESIVLKSADKNELLHAVDLTLKGRRYYSEEVLQLIVEKSTRSKPVQQSDHLTTSEMEIVKLIAEGLTSKEIALKKNISFHTVMTHRKNIFRKTGVSSVSELIMHAIKAGWIDNIEYYI